MTPDELLAAIDTIGWPMREVARRLGCDPVLVQRWSQGTATVPASIARWLSTLAAFHARHQAPKDWRVR